MLWEYELKPRPFFILLLFVCLLNLETSDSLISVFYLCVLCIFLVELLLIRFWNSWLYPSCLYLLFNTYFLLYKFSLSFLVHITEIFFSLSSSSYNLYISSAIIFSLLRTFSYSQMFLFRDAYS